jgi:hypothetical protein
MSDFSELYELAADLTDVPAEANRNIDKAMKFTSVEIKDDWQQGAEATGLEGYAASIDFDIKYPGGAIESEIGPNLGKRQGKFGLVEAGGGKVRSSPQHAGRDAYEANKDDFFRGLEIAATDAVIDKVAT